MSKPHPRGPRAFRNLFESDRRPGDREWLKSGLTVNLAATSPGEEPHFTITESTAMNPVIPLSTSPVVSLDRLPGTATAQGIDLTAFAGRVVLTTSALGARFELPAGFSSRLNALRPTVFSSLDQGQLADLGSTHLSASVAR